MITYSLISLQCKYRPKCDIIRPSSLQLPIEVRQHILNRILILDPAQPVDDLLDDQNSWTQTLAELRRLSGITGIPLPDELAILPVPIAPAPSQGVPSAPVTPSRRANASAATPSRGVNDSPDTPSRGPGRPAFPRHLVVGYFVWQVCLLPRRKGDSDLTGL